MPYRICKTFEIESGHMLSKHPGLCKFPHGHSRTVEIVMEADALDQNEMVCDFKLIKEIMGDFLRLWDHAFCVNTDDPQYSALRAAYGERIIAFPSKDPTTEMMAKLIYGLAKIKLNLEIQAACVRASVRIVRVRVWETSSSWAEYQP